MNLYIDVFPFETETRMIYVAKSIFDMNTQAKSKQIWGTALTVFVAFFKRGRFLTTSVNFIQDDILDD